MAPPLEFERKGWSMKSWVQNPLDAFKVPKMNKIIISYPYWLNKTISNHYAPHITYNNNIKQTLILKFWGWLWILKAQPHVFFFVILFYSIQNHTLYYLLKWHFHFYYYYKCFFFFRHLFLFLSLNQITLTYWCICITYYIWKNKTKTIGLVKKKII